MSESPGLCDTSLRRQLRTITLLATAATLPHAWIGTSITIKLVLFPWLHAPASLVLPVVIFEVFFCLLLAGLVLVVWAHLGRRSLAEQVMKLRLARASFFLSAFVSPIPWAVVLFFVPYFLARLSSLADAVRASDMNEAGRAAGDASQSLYLVLGWLGLVLALSRIHRLIDRLEGRRP